METTIYQQALQAATEHRDLQITALTTGLINKTFKVQVENNGEQFVLQQINSYVFSNPEAVQVNYLQIWEHLQTGGQDAMQYPVTIPAPLAFPNGDYLFCDKHKRYWRMFEFIANAKTVHSPADSSQVREVAQAFGSLTAHFAGYDTSAIHVTIKGFHDLSLRYEQFKKALQNRNYERLQKAAPFIHLIKSREHYVSFYEVITSSEAFRKRLMHHDAKIGNVLFDADNDQLIGPVDFDTCMPGYFFSDLGDIIRTMVANEDENCKDDEKIFVREDYYAAILEGYNDAMHGELTPAEQNHIHYSGPLVIYMQALRFLTDYLNNDQYYHTQYADQNLHRAKNQLLLLDKLEAFLKTNYGFGK